MLIREGIFFINKISLCLMAVIMLIAYQGGANPKTNTNSINATDPPLNFFGSKTRKRHFPNHS